MHPDIHRIAVNTGGGDAPGLNAVIRAVVRSATALGWEVYGIRDSYDGLFEEGGVIPLDHGSVRGITHLGGTILGTTNRGNPLRWPTKGADGTVTYSDRSQEVVDRLKELDIDSALRASERIVLLLPAHLEERRDRGLLYRQAGHKEAAIADLRDYLDAFPHAPDAPRVRRRMRL